jgi:histidyl-tRNA synthetase
MDPHAFSRPDGFHDFDAAATRSRDRIEDELLRCFARFGYDAITVPSVEYAELYNPARIGDELYHQLLMARLAEPARFPIGPSDSEETEARADLSQEDSDTSYDVVLRPDLTAPVARMVVTRLLSGDLDLSQPLRLAVSGQVFRNRSPEGGTLKELRHVGAELIGDDGALADRELLDLACSGLMALGDMLEDAKGEGSKGERAPVALRLGHARLPGLVLAALGVPPANRARIQTQLEGYDAYRCRIQRSAPGSFSRALPRLRAELQARLRRSKHELVLGADAPAAAAPDAVNAYWREALPAAYLDDLAEAWRRTALLSRDAIQALLALAPIESDASRLRAGMAKHLPDGRARVAVFGLIDELRSLSEAPDASRSALNATSVAPFMRRGLGYYSGVVFELHTPLEASLHTRLCGGGRYGDLYDWIYARARHTRRLRSGDRDLSAALPGTQSLTSVGLAFGLDRLADWAQESAVGGPAPCGVLVVPLTPGDALAAYDLAAYLRTQCERVRLARLGGATTRGSVAERVKGQTPERFTVGVHGASLELLDRRESRDSGAPARAVSRAELLEAMACAADCPREPDDLRGEG